ncbi:iron-containing redox enzyme family protein [Stenoxybacter acetivorans]|uniref:iron-containing redox enzyme family protein n=1 Tax=Stenoxybacter acetivorans TaxID=422441 RepID=UPI000562FA67|nr:iron-containing redox enzyme family protein [Stenoxybacter acetivorans]
MSKRNSIEKDLPALQDMYWPPVGVFRSNANIDCILNSFDFSDFFKKDSGFDQVGEKINISLNLIYSYIYNYRDSPIFNIKDTGFESKIYYKKHEIEDYFIQNWLGLLETKSNILTQQELADYFEKISIHNAGLNHQFFDYVATEMTLDSMLHFLKTEICRNEYVDDEVSMLGLGLQGAMKKVVASNFWDECGNGVLQNFHTYWLRRLLHQMGTEDEFLSWRNVDKPWFTSLTSNIFNALLTRPSMRLSAYGCFTTTEQWVECHFSKIMAGMKRLGLDNDDYLIYFEKHHTIDPHHTYELVEAIRYQTPLLTSQEIDKIYYGSQLAIVTAVHAYDRMLSFYKSKDCQSC